MTRYTHRKGYLIHTDYEPKPIPTEQYDWYATCMDYDGAPDSCDGFDNYYGPPSPNSCVGTGNTEEAAIADLLTQLEAFEIHDDHLEECKADADRTGERL